MAITFVGVQLFRSPVSHVELPPAVHSLHEYTKDELHSIIGREPTLEEIESANCTEQGMMGHLQCGCCIAHQVPRKVCRCLAPHGDITDPIPAFRVVMQNYSCSVEIERIFGWPGLEAFESIGSRLMAYVGESMTERAHASIMTDVECFLRELVGRGVLYRGSLGAWYYKPCDEKQGPASGGGEKMSLYRYGMNPPRPGYDLRARVAELEAERDGLRARVAELEAARDLIAAGWDMARGELERDEAREVEESERRCEQIRAELWPQQGGE